MLCSCVFVSCAYYHCVLFIDQGLAPPPNPPAHPRAHPAATHYPTPCRVTTQPRPIHTHTPPSTPTGFFAHASTFQNPPTNHCHSTPPHTSHPPALTQPDPTLSAPPRSEGRASDGGTGASATSEGAGASAGRRGNAAGASAGKRGNAVGAPASGKAGASASSAAGAPAGALAGALAGSTAGASASSAAGALAGSMAGVSGRPTTCKDKKAVANLSNSVTYHLLIIKLHTPVQVR